MEIIKISSNLIIKVFSFQLHQTLKACTIWALKAHRNQFDPRARKGHQLITSAFWATVRALASLARRATIVSLAATVAGPQGPTAYLRMGLQAFAWSYYMVVNVVDLGIVTVGRPGQRQREHGGRPRSPRAEGDSRKYY